MCKCIKCNECLERQKKYYNENKEDIIRRSKEYYNNHKEELKEVRKEYKKEYMKDYMKEYRSRKKIDPNEDLNNKIESNKDLNSKIECECGGRYTKRNKSTHMKTKKHQEYVSNLEK